MKYYKGILVLSDNIKLKALKFNSNKARDYSLVKIKFIKSNYQLNFDENMNLNEIMLYKYSTINDDTKKIIYKIITSGQHYNKSEVPIIYKKIYDNYGNEFAREINTGLIFPLFNYNNLKVDLNYKIIRNINKDLISVKGSFTPSFNDDTIKCYCLEDSIATTNDIFEYNKSDNVYECNQFGIYEKRKNILLHNLCDMNNINMENFNEQPKRKYFCANVRPSFSNNESNKPTAGININDIIQPVVEQALNDTKLSINNDTNVNKNNISNLLQIKHTTQIDELKDIKMIIELLSDEDISILRDMTNNNLHNDPNIRKYLKMSRKEKLEFLDSKSKQKNKHKVELKKK